ncbi:uncharacterized protein [Watersipora subatra]|uniref:uncharacterized protein n=1 Tax=Watersipora subatra TaxID=2589382 RepID=UPI00355AEAFC
MISPEHEQHKAFSEDFAEAIESYRSSTFIKSSRSSTMSSLSGQFMTDSQASSGSSASPMHVYQQLSQRVDNFKRSPQANADVAEGTQIVPAANREGRDYTSPSETEKSSPSLSNQGSMRSLASLTSLRRGSCTSQSSIDQSGEHTDDLSPHRTVRKDRRVKSSSTFSLEGPVADRDSSSPIPVVDHVREVKDQVLDGFSKISTQAKTLISNIKGRTISQPVMERILSATTWDDASGEGSLECKDSWEDGDSRQAFFIGDEEIGFGDEMPTGLGPFLSLTDLRYSELTDPVNLLDENDEVEQLLTEWSERLCLVLSQYTRTASVSTPEGRTLRHLTRICPWRMNMRMAKKCEYLATLCVIHSGSEPILDYFIDRKSESIPPYLISDVVQVSQYTALEQGRKGKAIQSSLFGRSTNLENENTRAKISSSSASSVSSISGLVSTGECSANHNENTFEITEQIESNTELSMQGSQNGSTSPTNHGLPSPNTGISLASDIECNISFTAPSAESSVVLACQFMSVFWFLMNARELCSYVEHLCSANSTLRKQKAIWTALINCLIGGTHDKLEWKPVFTTSLFTSSDVSRGLLEQKDKPRLWLIVYLLMRQQQFDEAISIALASQLQVPPLHIMYCLRACAELDNLPLSTVHQLFSGYVLSSIQQQDSSSRPMFVKEMSQSGIVDFWMESLEGSWKSDSMYQSQCVCGQPNLLTADSLPSNLRALQHILEENMVHIPRVKSTILLIGGAMALVRLKKKEDDKEDLLKLLLLATDISLFQQLIAGLQITRENCLYLLNQRASQQTTETERLSCLWCQKTYNRSEPLLTWDSVAEVILERLGPETCVDVLLESSIPKNSVSNNFFSKCVSVHEHDVQSSQLVNDAIDGLERFLWSTELTNNCCDSRLYQLILKEVELHKSVRDGLSIIDSEQDELVEMGHALQETRSLRTLEDAEVHWGTVVSVSDDCYYCGLCLSQANVAVTVFQCGHSVHHDCCQASHGCVQCQSKM